MKSAEKPRITHVITKSGIIHIEGDIAHADWESKELLRKGAISKSHYKALQIHIHYLRESVAGINPPRPYWSLQRNENLE